MLFIGHTRFSLLNPNSSSWRATDGVRFSDAEAYREYLYSDERLRLRSDVFLNLSMPQLDLGRKGHDVIHVVSYSDSLPRRYQILLEDAAEQFPFLVLDRHQGADGPMDLVDLARKRFLETIGRYQGESFATYRLDDDDLLSVDYFDQMAPYVVPANAGMQASLPKGITGLHSDKGISNLRESYWPMHSMGHLNICAFELDGSAIIPNPSPHNLSDRVNPVIIDARKPSYFWLRHLNQDTSIDYSPAEARSQLVRNMQRYPAVSSHDSVLEAFPLLRGRLLDPTPVAVLERVVPLTESYEVVNFATRLSSFAVEVDIDAGPAAVSNNALISFDLVDMSGQSVDHEEFAVALASAGIARSRNREIGFYRYLETPEGRHRATFAAALPDGVVCSGVSVRRWARNETQLSLNRLSVLPL